jgi:hypothetical protein
LECAVRLTRPRTLYLLFLLVLGFLSLRPYPPAERLLDGLLLPTRLLGELTTPASWFTGNSVRASAAAGASEEVARRDALLDAVLAAAEPRRRGLLVGRDWVHGEVVERGGSALDRVTIALPEQARIERGMPVVSGEAFVGWIDEPQRSRPGYWDVRLVTAGAARVGAWLETPGKLDPSAFFVAGGLAPMGGTELVLGVHNPSRGDLPRGTVEVYEPRAPGEMPWARLANGFRLGTLLREQRGPREVLGILPELDYRSGLFEVLVLCPEGWNPPEVIKRRDPMFDGGWARSRFLLDGAPTPRRAGRRLASGRLAGLEPGAAVVDATRLVGRVAALGWADAAVSLPADPGFSIPALAHPLDGGPPLVLGRLVSLGLASVAPVAPVAPVTPATDGAARRAAPATSATPATPATKVAAPAAEGDLLFRWEASLPLPAGSALAVHIHTGSGDRGLPRGLWLGDALLPGGAGPFEIVVKPAGPTPPAGAELWVRLTAGGER